MTRTPKSKVPGNFKCLDPDCAKNPPTFGRSSDMMRHYRIKHDESFEPFTCPQCPGSQFNQRNNLDHHNLTVHKIPWIKKDRRSKASDKSTRIGTASKKGKAHKPSDSRNPVPSSSISAVPYPGQIVFSVNTSAHLDVGLTPERNNEHLSPSGLTPTLPRRPVAATESSLKDPADMVIANPFTVPHAQSSCKFSSFSSTGITINGDLPQRSLFQSAPAPSPAAPIADASLLGPPATIIPSMHNTSPSSFTASFSVVSAYDSPVQELPGLAWSSPHCSSSVSTPNGFHDDLPAFWGYPSAPGSAPYTPAMSSSSLGPSTPITPYFSDMFLSSAPSQEDSTLTTSVSNLSGISSQKLHSQATVSSSNVSEQASCTEMPNTTHATALKRPVTTAPSPRMRPYPLPRSQQYPMSYAAVVATDAKKSSVVVPAQHSMQQFQPSSGPFTYGAPSGLLFQPSPNVTAHSNMCASISLPVSHSHSSVDADPSVPLPTRFAQGACMTPQGQIFQQETANSWRSELAPSTVTSQQAHMPSYGSVLGSLPHSTNPNSFNAIRMPNYTTTNIWPSMGSDQANLNDPWETGCVSGGMPMISMPVNTALMNATALNAPPTTIPVKNAAPINRADLTPFTIDTALLIPNKGLAANGNMQFLDNNFLNSNFRYAEDSPPAPPPMLVIGTPPEAPRFTPTSLQSNGFYL